MIAMSRTSIIDLLIAIVRAFFGRHTRLGRKLAKVLMAFDPIPTRSVNYRPKHHRSHARA